MANIKSAIKRAELNVKQNEKNSAQKSALRTTIKAFKANPTEEAFRAASASIDKAASKGLIHKNKASRDRLIILHDQYLIHPFAPLPLFLRLIFFFVSLI